MMTNARRIATIEAQPGYRLKVTWQDGGAAVVDMTGVVHRQAHFASLKDEAAFRQATVIGYGTGIEWANGLDYSADSIEVMASKQTAMTPNEFRAWKREMEL